jgi:hypothetical protein
MAALICTKAGRRPRLVYRIHLDTGPAMGRRKGFTETDYARLLDAAHQQLGDPTRTFFVCWWYIARMALTCANAGFAESWRELVRVWSGS